MKKLDVGYMYLSITRRCTLKCIHCLRGDCQDVDMSEKIIDNALRDVTHISELQFGGGEPLMVPQIMETIIRKIREYGIIVDKFNIVTNGTILTPRVIEVIEQLKEIANLEVALSHDKFHLIEQYRIGLYDIVQKNNETFIKLLGYNPRDKELNMDYGTILPMGRAKELTQETLLAINLWLEPTQYYLLSDESLNIQHRIGVHNFNEEIVKSHGRIMISATGYLTANDQEYEEEDKSPIHIKDKSLLEALIECENNYRSNSKNGGLGDNPADKISRNRK